MFAIACITLFNYFLISKFKPVKKKQYEKHDLISPFQLLSAHRCSHKNKSKKTIRRKIPKQEARNVVLGDTKEKIKQKQ
jgi:hypothetical protein